MKTIYNIKYSNEVNPYKYYLTVFNQSFIYIMFDNIIFFNDDLLSNVNKKQYSLKTMQKHRNILNVLKYHHEFKGQKIIRNE